MISAVLRFGNLEDILQLKKIEVDLILEQKRKIENDICEYIEEGNRMGLTTDPEDPFIVELESGIFALDAEMSIIFNKIRALESELRYVSEKPTG